MITPTIGLLGYLRKSLNDTKGIIQKNPKTGKYSVSLTPVKNVARSVAQGAVDVNKRRVQQIQQAGRQAYTWATTPGTNPVYDILQASKTTKLPVFTKRNIANPYARQVAQFGSNALLQGPHMLTQGIATRKPIQAGFGFLQSRFPIGTQTFKAFSGTYPALNTLVRTRSPQKTTMSFLKGANRWAMPSETLAGTRFGPGTPVGSALDIVDLSLGLIGKGIDDRALRKLSRLNPKAMSKVMELYGGAKATGYKRAEGKFSSLADKKTKFHIDDSKARLILPKDINKKTYPLGKIFGHEELFKQYPEFKNMPVTAYDLQGGEQAMFNGREIIFDTKFLKHPSAYPNVKIIQPSGKVISIELPAKDKLKAVILHEIMHVIQKKEGFASGSSPNIKSTQKADVRAALDKYRRTAGEIEARDVESQMNLTLDERMRVSPYTSQQIPLKDWIVKKQVKDESLTGKVSNLVQERLAKTTQPKSLVKGTTYQSAVPIPKKTGQSSYKYSIPNPDDPFYNINRLKIPPKQKRVLKEKITGEFKQPFEKATGKKLTHDEIVRTAQVTSDDIIRTIGRKKTAELGAAQLRLRQSIAQMVTDGNVSKELLEKIKVDKAFSKSTARLLGQRAIDATPQTPNGRLLQKMLKNILDVDDDIGKIVAAAQKYDLNNPQQAAMFYRKFVKPSAGEWFDKLRYNSMLTSPNTHIINTSSNLQGTGILTPIQKTVEGGIDSALSALTGRARTRFAGEGAEYAKGYYGGVKEAYKKFFDVIQQKDFGEHPDVYNVPLATKKTPRLIESVLDIGGRFLVASDEFFKTLTRQGIERSYTYRAQKLGKTLTADDLSTKAANEARELLFQGDFTKSGAGVFSNAIGSLGKSVRQLTYSDNRALRWGAKLTFPFVKIGTNLAKMGFEYSPVTGSLNMIGNTDKTAQLAKILIGTGITAVTVPFALDNRLTFDRNPVNTKLGKLEREGNIPPYSLKVGDTWYSYTKMHPAISWNLATVAAITDAWKSKRLTENAGVAIMEGLWSSLKFGLDQTYYKNVADFMRGMSGEFTEFASIPANYLSQFIPFRAFASWLNRAVDHYQRKPDDNANFAKQSLQQIMSQLPGFSQMVPVKTNTAGEPMMKSNVYRNLFLPFKTMQENEPYATQYRELQNITPELQMLRKQKEESQTQSQEIVNEMYKAIQGKSPEEKKQILQAYQQQGTLTDETGKELLSKIKEEKRAWTPAESAVYRLGVDEEAQYHWGKLQKMSSAERKAYLTNLVQRGLITEQTLEAIMKLKTQQQ